LSSARPEPSPIRFLVVCEEAGPLVSVLVEAGVREEDIESTASLYRAVASFAQRPAGGVVVDLDLVDRSGMDCIRLFTEIHPPVRILALFSQANRRRAADALAAGAECTLLQPFYPSELAAVVRRWRAPARETAAEGIAPAAHLAALARLAKGTAHEINNPLTTLSGWLQMMELDAGRSVEERKRLASMREEADRIAAVVEHLLAFGEDTLAERAPVDLGAVLSDLVEAARNRAGKATVECRLEADRTSVTGDERLLRRACGLLLDDALAACNGGGTVFVGLRSGGENAVEVVIRDSGRPLPREHLAHLFEPYRCPARLGEGAGLAYPAVHGIVRCHGGEVAVTSNERNGTEFRLRLPTA